jgi:chromosome segregation ATPase
MDTKNWIEALGLALQYPVLLVAAFLIAGAAFGFAWWLRGHWAMGQIEARDQRLELARERLADVQSDLSSTRTELENALKKVADQEREITGLRERRGVETVAVDRLARSNTAIRNDLSSLMTSTSNLNDDLMLVVRALAKPSATKRIE